MDMIHACSTISSMVALTQSSAASATSATAGCLSLQARLRVRFPRLPLVAEPVAAAAVGSGPGASSPRPRSASGHLLPHVGKLFAQERNHGISGSVLLPGRLLCAGREERRKGPVKLGRVNLPSAVLVARGGNLARFDVPQHGALVDASGGGCGCQIVHGGSSLLLRG
jgi:hypothetical protein